MTAFNPDAPTVTEYVPGEGAPHVRRGPRMHVIAGDPDGHAADWLEARQELLGDRWTGALR